MKRVSLLRTISHIIAYAMVTAAVGVLLATTFRTPTARVQITWTLMGFLGAAFTVGNLFNAIEDKSALVAKGRNGDLQRTANQAIRQESIRLSQMVSIVFIGIYVLTAQPTLTTAQRHALHIPEWTTSSIAITTALFWVVFGTVLQAYLDRRWRQHFYNRRIDD